MTDELLAIGSHGQRLMICLTGPALPSLTEELWPARIEVEAHPFSGTIEAVFTGDDVAQCRAALTVLARDHKVTLGGGRAALVTLQADGPIIEVGVTPQGDDPWPSLRFLLASPSRRSL